MKKKYALIGIFLSGLAFVFFVKYENDKYSETQNKGISSTILSGSINVKNIEEKEEIIANEEQIQINILGEDILKIDKSRLNDNDYYYDDLRLDNRWELDEIDIIFDTIKGDWEIKEYAGFIPIGFYNFLLHTREDRRLMGIEKEEEAFEDYSNKIEAAKQNIPEFWISTNPVDFKKYNKTSVINKIYTNGENESPTSIILCNSIEDEKDYPKFRAQTSISKDFEVKYPVIYIEFFIIEIDDINVYDVEKNKYTPATLVFPSDNTAYILIGGAFYTIERRE